MLESASPVNKPPSVLVAIAVGDTGQPSVVLVESGVGYAIAIGFSWSVFGFVLGVILRSFAGAISVDFWVSVRRDLCYSGKWCLIGTVLWCWP